MQIMGSKMQYLSTTVFIVVGMLVGVTTAVVWRETLHAYVYSLIPAFLLALVSIVVVSLLTTEKRIERFD